MSITTEQAVALAEKHGAIKPLGIYPKAVLMYPGQLTAMLNDRDQQVIEQLVQASVVMPEPDDYTMTIGGHGQAVNVHHISVGKVRVAIATMQAQNEKLQAKIQEQALRYLSLDGQAAELQTRVEQLERKLIECRSSVKYDYNNWDRLVMRKQQQGTLNQCDTDEFNRVGELLNYIDEAKHTEKL